MKHLHSLFSVLKIYSVTVVSDNYKVSQCPYPDLWGLQMFSLHCVFFSSSGTTSCHHTVVTSVSPWCSAGISHYDNTGAPRANELTLHPYFLPLSACLPIVSLSLSPCLHLTSPSTDFPSAALDWWHWSASHQRCDSEGDACQNIQLISVVMATLSTSWETPGNYFNASLEE